MLIQSIKQSTLPNLLYHFKKISFLFLSFQIPYVCVDKSVKFINVLNIKILI